MGSSSPKTPATDYSMSVHLGLCAGPVDAFLQIYAGEKLAWEGEVTEEAELFIQDLDLHGGPRQEGGVEGMAYFLPGTPTQLMPEHLATKFGLTSATCPGYRGVASIFFHGGNPTFSDLVEDAEAVAFILGRGNLTTMSTAAQLQNANNLNGVKGQTGFYWQTNNPTLKTLWAKVRRRPRGLLEANSMIGPDANPAHMIYECLTNTDWGMGASPSAVDTQSFLDAAVTLYEENFGLSMMWVQQAAIESQISEIIDHINATIYVNPRTGLLTLKLLRADYIAEDAPLFTPANCVVQKFARMGEGEIANEITVTWTNPENEEDATVTQQNLAGISAVGSIIPAGLNYYGIRNIDLACFVLNRDIRSRTAPLAKCELVCMRSAWTLTPGAVLRLTYPEHRLNGVVFRVGNVDYGKPGSTAVRVSIVEDIFGFDPGNYSIPSQSQWVDTSQLPDPFDQQQAFTMPYVLSRLVDAEVGVYPNAMFGFLAGTDNPDAYGFDLQVETLMSDNTLQYADLSALSVTSRAVLSDTFPAEASTMVAAFPAGSTGPAPVTGGFIILGDGDDTAREWVYIKSASQDSNSIVGYTLQRGVMDTVPREWPAGTQVWFIDPTVTFYDDTLWPAESAENFKLLMRTSLGKLAAADAPVLAAAASERPHLPYRPANVQVEGTAWATILAPLDQTGAIALTVTWANRNRDTEDTVIFGWTDAGVTPPLGQTTTVTVLAPDGTTVWTTNDGLTGETYELDPGDFLGPVGIVRVTSKLDGFESLQGHEIAVKVRDGGYGFDYGVNYGGV